MSVIYRYEVPVDDRWHERALSGAVVHVAARKVDMVEFWALHTGDESMPRSFRVVGTGQPLPKGEDEYVNVRHIGPAIIGFLCGI